MEVEHIALSLPMFRDWCIHTGDYHARQSVERFLAMTPNQRAAAARAMREKARKAGGK